MAPRHRISLRIIFFIVSLEAQCTSDFILYMSMRLTPKILIALTATALSVGCRLDYSYVRNFPEKGEITYTVTPYNAAEMYPLSIQHIPEGYWVCQLLKSEHCFALLDEDLNEIVRFGKKGRGPEEFTDPNFVGSTGSTGDSLFLLIRDWTKGCLYRTAVNIHDGGTHSSIIRGYSTGMRTIYPLGKGRFLCNGDANRYFLDDNGLFTYLEGWGEDVNEALENSATYIPDNQTLELFSKDSSRVLVYSISYPILYLHATDDGSLLNKTYVEMRPEDFPKDGYCPLYFAGGGYIGDHIALLLCDDSKMVSRILIFDRDLKPAASYDVPFVNTLEIDTSTGKALSLDYENELTYIFDLSQWL